MKTDVIKGYGLAAFAAAAYGTNPAFALPLYEQGMNPVSVLLFRYVLGLPILFIIMRFRGIGISLRKNEIFPVSVLGVFMAFSSLTLFESYEYMNSGVASTLLFVYPIMVAMLMAFFFKEKFKISIVMCLMLMSVGLYFLMKPQGDVTLSPYGFILVMISALTYAFYIIIVNVSKTVKHIPTTKLLFYILLSGSVVYLFFIIGGTQMTLPVKSVGWINLSALALVPTLISLACTTRAIQLIGSTPTAILGALEPVSAVVLSVTVLGQTLSAGDVIGGLFIIVATTVVVANEPVDRALLHVRKMFPRQNK